MTAPDIRRLRVGLALTSALVLIGCGGWFGEEEVPLPGERISVLAAETKLKPDPGSEQRTIQLPRPTPNPEWPQNGGYPDHIMHHIAIGQVPQEDWRVGIGKGSSRRQRLISPPIVAAGRVFTMDANGQVSAFDAGNGSRLWRIDTRPEDDRDGLLGGGLAYDGKRVFVATGLAELIALDTAAGEVAWRRSLAGPMRAPPTVLGGRVFAVTVDNQLFALSAEDGSTLWSHRGLAETASLLGAASPAAAGDLVVVAYSSGELFAFRVENGRLLWSDSLAVGRRTGAVATMPGVRALPLIDRGRVYAISNGGLFVAIELRTGQRLWEREIGGVETPWLAGNYIFQLTTARELICFSRQDGRILWITTLPGFADPVKLKDPISWTGPVLASDRLIVAGTHGWALAVSPYSGRIQGIQRLPDGVAISPIISNETVFFLTDEGELVAYR